MRYIFLSFFTIFTFYCKKSLANGPITFNQLPLSKKIKNNLLEGEIYTSSTVESKEKKQSFNYKIVGLHQKKCSRVLPKLAMYESYKDFIGFVKQSEYDTQNQRVKFKLSSTLLPFDMILFFKIPRVNKIGVYPFLFDAGILAGLTGKVHASQHQNRCLLSVDAKWQGKDTGINDFVMEFFTKALGELGLKKLFRMTGNNS